MISNTKWVDNDEFGRLVALSEYDLDYNVLQSKFEDLTRLASMIAGTEISLVNLLDAYNQWTIAQQGAHLEHMAREKSVCQYTIQQEQEFEVRHLSTDLRFNKRDYVTQTGLDYYYGIPLTTEQGYHIGALCVLDKENKVLTVAQKQMLQLIGKEIISRLESIKQLERLETQNRQLVNAKKILAHDIRGPIAGIIGLAQVASTDDEATSTEEIQEYFKLIKESGESVLELAAEILEQDAKTGDAIKSLPHMISLVGLKEKLTQLFAPRLKEKGLNFFVKLSPLTAAVTFPKNKLQQVIGNLISNAIKFTSIGGTITLDLNLLKVHNQNHLEVRVTDTGVGMEKDKVQAILSGTSESTEGTGGEVGYGLGLKLVKQLIEESNGILYVNSIIGQGTVFRFVIPLR
ncbi:HAMP domain-containing histidine kinase [Mucilaginibacter robiniae]|uniref:histidine kinase n=1 Tax=Mucilaginibacter robiniae TaxID=2728022 RepID=A0A7L5E2Y3_9SPHI|nr:HAMP domain-containing sensor histidine kinase [Mucilaginibacter robiniae]QJD97740.1 HAMP domain-containing histidine kinase [Mucilaginibacter robiniae]